MGLDEDEVLRLLHAFRQPPAGAGSAAGSSSDKDWELLQGEDDLVSYDAEVRRNPRKQLLGGGSACGGSLLRRGLHGMHGAQGWGGCRVCLLQTGRPGAAGNAGTACRNMVSAATTRSQLFWCGVQDWENNDLYTSGLILDLAEDLQVSIGTRLDTITCLT
jgi:hypothetical protein